MVFCAHCGEDAKQLSFRCKFCGNYFCAKHRLPEYHRCPGLAKHRKETHINKLYMSLSYNRPEKFGGSRRRKPRRAFHEEPASPSTTPNLTLLGNVPKQQDEGGAKYRGPSRHKSCPVEPLWLVFWFLKLSLFGIMLLLFVWVAVSLFG